MVGDYITNPMYQKTSAYFNFHMELNDSDCSEEYEKDQFFDGSE